MNQYTARRRVIVTEQTIVTKSRLVEIYGPADWTEKEWSDAALHFGNNLDAPVLQLAEDDGGTDNSIKVEYAIESYQFIEHDWEDFLDGGYDNPPAFVPHQYVEIFDKTYINVYNSHFGWVISGNLVDTPNLYKIRLSSGHTVWTNRLKPATEEDFNKEVDSHK